MSLKNTILEPPNLIIGYTTRYHLLLDLDNTTQEKATMLIRMIMQQYSKVGDCLLIQSNNRSYEELLLYRPEQHPKLVRRLLNYHAVFDNLIGYNFACTIIKTIAYLGVLNRDYIKIRMFRGDMTLRVSKAILIRGTKQQPIVVDYIHNPYTTTYDGYIWDYLNFLFAVSTL